jgi:hypothetical protein
MATENGRQTRANSGTRKGRKNNPTGRNQYTGIMRTARGNPVTTAVAVGGAVAAGIFLWSRRNQIGDQIASLSDQASDWREGVQSDRTTAAGDPGSSENGVGNSGRDGDRTQVEIAQEALTLKEIGTTA